MRIFGLGTRLVRVIVIASITFDASGNSAAPVGLLVNGVSQPLAIDRDDTRFTWRSVASRRGERQTAYQILVCSSPERLAAGTADWWDSGKVSSSRSAS